MGTITLSDQQQRQAEILTRLISGRLTPADAAQLLGVSSRHLRRLRTLFEQEGVSCLVHGNAGRAPKHKTASEQAAQIVALASDTGPYHGFSVSHLHDLLLERHEITVGRSTLDRLLKQVGILKPRGRGKSARRYQRRERKPSEGMLVQVDGSPHDWLEGRGHGLRLCLVGGCDDATSKVLDLRFHESETQNAYLMLFRSIAVNHGLPMAFYHDRHTILRSPKEATIEDELAGRKPMSQVQRVLHELGVESIAALSPQAKGRIERLWKTLQDRLVKEMRLAQVTTMEGANAFLPTFMERFNARFAKSATEIEAAWVELPDDFDLVRHFSVQEFRVVKSDNTFAYLGRTFQVTEKASFARQRVAIHVTPEGEVAVYTTNTLRNTNMVRISCHEITLRVQEQKQEERQVAPVMKEKEKSEVTAVNLPKNASAKQRGWLYGGNSGYGART
jgi:transposase